MLLKFGVKAGAEKLSKFGQKDGSELTETAQHIYMAGTARVKRPALPG
jgi:hypothetical protein